jgi:hypothetical protein
VITSSGGSALIASQRKGLKGPERRGRHSGGGRYGRCWGIWMDLLVLEIEGHTRRVGRLVRSRQPQAPNLDSGPSSSQRVSAPYCGAILPINVQVIPTDDRTNGANAQI